jgi:hypothetical protein
MTRMTKSDIHSHEIEAEAKIELATSISKKPHGSANGTNMPSSPIVAYPQMHARANSELTKEERTAKVSLKRRLKQHAKLKKFETRLQQAIDRKDRTIEERARHELKEFRQGLMDDKDSILNVADSDQVEAKDDGDSEIIQQGRSHILAIYKQLLQIMCTDQESTDKQFQTDQARTLLLNMTKGTQTESMFDNSTALLGYTRQKFSERAALALSSLDKLKLRRPVSSSTQPLLECLMKTQSICSIGCGPGCDAVGVLSFLRAHECNLERVVLMDYVMPQWKKLIIDPLMGVLIPSYVPQIDTASCDIRFSIHHPSNDSALTELIRGADDSSVVSSKIDMIVISYVLTETRGKWHAFLQDLVKMLRPGTLLLMSEPTAWQLHHFLDLCGDHLDCHEWLDSSRWTPALQPLEGRIGPAVLLVRVK